jgi:heptosyltransferase I
VILSDKPKDICVLRLSAIGDVCHAVAVVQAIQSYYPESKITWVIGKVEAALLKGLPGVNFVVFDKSQGKLAYQKIKREFQNTTFDVLLHMQVALRANLVARCISRQSKNWLRLAAS